MNILTADKCRILLGTLLQSDTRSTKEDLYMQALKKALPLLEQQEREMSVWIEWRGGNQPVNDEARVIVKLKYAGEQLEGDAGEWEWTYEEASDPIIAYRLMKAAQPTTDIYRQIENDGWIEWGGGECPVNPMAIVEVKFTLTPQGEGIANWWDWHHGEGKNNIIAYRVIENDGREG